MTQNPIQFQSDNWLNQHLEFNFVKNSLNTTCQSQNTLVFQKDQISHRPSVVQNSIEQNKAIQKPQKFTKQSKQGKNQPISKKSRCFIQQINKVLKKNKLQNQTKQKNHQLWDKSYLNVYPQKSKIHFKIQDQTKNIVHTGQKQNEGQKIHNEKSQFNLQQFLQKNVNKQNNKTHKNIKSPYFIGANIKKKTCFADILDQSSLSSPANNENILHDNLMGKQKDNRQKENSNCSQQKKKQRNSFDLFIQNLQSMNIQNLGKTFRNQQKPTKKLTFKEIKRNQIQKQIKNENLKLQRTLKRAMSNVSLNSTRNYRFSESVDRKSRLSVPLQNHNQILLDNQQTNEEIHFTKLKQKVEKKMEMYKKINQIRKIEDKQRIQRKSSKKIRVFSVQPKSSFTVQGIAIAESRNDKENGIFDKEIKKLRRPNTAITRTGLQYDHKQSHRRRSSNKQDRLIYLAGINNSANHFRTFTNNAQREVEELNECKSDRVVRNLQLKFSSRPKTAKNKNICQTSRPLTANRPKSCRNSQRPSGSFAGIQYQKITKKQIQKEKMKQKLLEIMIDCQEEKIYNKKLMNGITVFEDFCENIGQGLKNITSQIDQYIKR